MVGNDECDSDKNILYWVISSQAPKVNHGEGSETYSAGHLTGQAKGEEIVQTTK